MRSKLEFVREQGFADTDVELYEGLMFQPRVAGVLAAAGVLFQNAWVFAALGAVLWWSAIARTHNPFDAVYNLAVARSRGRARIQTGTAPRRFSAGMAGTVALGVAVALGSGATVGAWILQGLMVVAVAAVVFGRRCAGAALYWRLNATKRHGAQTLRDPLART